ncbi:MAG: hypothetical protein UIC65_04520 [Alphaproteobacteria bacterium]|nr:hypothetical protein [Alphaproteobacteria bacterium]
MKKISLFALLLSISYVSTAPAAKKSDGDGYAESWGVTEQLFCKGSGVQAGWGDYADKSSLKFAWAMMDNKSDGNTGYGAIYYVAREMDAHGYKFCQTVVAADRDGGCTIQPYTEYFNVNGIPKDCFWLCEKGYYGNGCNESVFQDEDKVSLDAHIERQKFVPKNYHVLYDIAKHTLFDNIEENIPMLKYNELGECGKNQRIDLNSNKKQEHDTVLAIRKIEVDKDNNSVTYTIQPLAVRAGGYTGCYRKGDDAAWPMLQWTGTEQSTFCPSSGFLHKENSAGGCYFTLKGEEAQSQAEQSAYKAAQTKAQSLEESGLAILCQGFDRAKYDNKVHVLNSDQFLYQNWRTRGTNAVPTKDEYCKDMTEEEKITCEANFEALYGDDDKFEELYGDASATCTVFVCKDEGMGYASDPMVSGDFTCVSCAENSDKTIHPLRLGRGNDGICKVCKVGEIVENGVCIEAKAIHKFYMGGVYDRNNSTVEKDIKDQCWTMSNPSTYKDCLNKAGWTNVKLTDQDKDNIPEEKSK